MLNLTAVFAQSPELVGLIVYHRHGARTPVGSDKLTHDFPNNITLPGEVPFWDFTGELTPVGMRQLYELGTEFRKRYITDIEFLPKNYSLD